MTEATTPSLAHELRAATKDAHSLVEKHPSVDALIMGSVPKEIHVQYLVALYRIYAALEANLADHATSPALCHVHDPAVLGRSNALHDDICYFLGVPAGTDWSQRVELNKGTQAAVDAYVNRITQLSNSTPTPAESASIYVLPPSSLSCPELLLAHAYVRYMGDLSGGQMAKKAIATAYSLPLDSIDGQRFYHFGQESSPSETKALKTRFREGMDKAGLQVDDAVRAAIVQEANHSFELNIKIFSSFAPLVPNMVAIDPSKARAIPITGADSSMSSNDSLDLDVSDSDASETADKATVVAAPAVKISKRETPPWQRHFVLFLVITLALFVGGQFKMPMLASATSAI